VNFAACGHTVSREGQKDEIRQKTGEDRHILHGPNTIE